MSGSFWIMIGIVAFVMLAQAVLWSWVFIQRRRIVPDVKIFNLRELYDDTRRRIDEAYRRRGTR